MPSFVPVPKVRLSPKQTMAGRLSGAADVAAAGRGSKACLAAGGEALFCPQPLARSSSRAIVRDNPAQGILPAASEAVLLRNAIIKV